MTAFPRAELTNSRLLLHSRPPNARNRHRRHPASKQLRQVLLQEQPAGEVVVRFPVNLHN